MSEFRSKLTTLFRGRGALDDDLASEIEAHLNLRVDDNIARGMPPEEARAEASRYFGNSVIAKENARESWQFRGLESMLKDLMYGLRGIRRAPAFSLAIILTLALGIGANTAIFSVVYNVLLRPLPYPAGERIVWLGESAGKATGISVTWINFQHWRNENHTFEDVAGYTRADFTLTGHGEPQLTHGAFVTAPFFPLTGAQPQLGRLFADADDHSGATPVAVLTWEFWNKTYGADLAVLNTTLALNGKLYQVIGVLRPGARPLLRTADYFLPLGPTKDRTTDRSAHGNIRLLGRLKPGVKLSQAVANLDEIMSRLSQADPGPESAHRAYGQYLTESITGSVRQTLLLLMGAVALLLIIACSNIASLLLVRAVARTREMAIRTAIGAGRARLVRQLLTENLLLSTLGGALGILTAQLCLRAMLRVAPEDLPRLSEIALDANVLLFAAAATVITGLLAGVAPVFLSSGVEVSGALKEGAPGSGSGPRGQRIRNVLVVAEVAITLVLSFGSGLLIRSLSIAQNTYPGFDSRNVLALELQLPSSAYKTDQLARQFYTQLVADLRGIPGVQTVGAVNCPPGAGDCGDWWYSVEGKPSPARADIPLTLFATADTNYFRAMHIRLVAGRAFNEGDRTGATPVTIINQDIARRWWPSPLAAVGQRIKFGGPYAEGDVMEIVGVAANVSQMGLDGERMPQMYFPFDQQGGRGMVVMLRAAGNPAAMIPAVRRRVAALDRNLPIQSLATLDANLGATLQRRRFSTLLLGIFASLAMILAAIGIFGVLNYWVSVRHKEIAVRMALGAGPGSIQRWAGSHAMRLALAGIAVGSAASWGASRWLTSMVYGVSVRSPLMMLIAVALVIALIALAAALPVWRASRVDVGRNLHEA